MDKNEIISFAKYNVKQLEAKLQEAEFALKRAQRQVKELQIQQESYKTLLELLDKQGTEND
jgi:multidrug resistance efflux pump